MVKKLQILLTSFFAIIILGCDPAFEHEFKGRIICKESNEPLESVKLEYTFLPIENFHHWRSNGIDKDPTKFTDKEGEFDISFGTVTLAYDSLKITLSKEGYKDKILISEQEEWKSGLGFNLRKFRFNFGEINLEKNEN